MSLPLCLMPQWYPEELELLQSVGVTPPQLGDAWEKRTFTVQGEEWTVEVTITPAPAHFFDFKITDSEGKVWHLATGSGTLNDYWPAVMQFAKSMIVVKSVADAP